MNSRLKKSIVIQVTVISIVIVLLIATILLGGRIRRIRNDIYDIQINLNQSLDNIIRQNSYREQLAARQFDINRLRAMTPKREQIGDIVSILEEEAKNNNLIITIPTISEMTTADDNKSQDITSATVLPEVNIQADLLGAPVNLIHFLHSVEHLPYLIRVNSFDFILESAKRPVGASLRVPDLTPPGNITPVTPAPTGKLHLNLILSTSDR